MSHRGIKYRDGGDDTRKRTPVHGSQCAVRALLLGNGCAETSASEPWGTAVFFFQLDSSSFRYWQSAFSDPKGKTFPLLPVPLSWK